MKKFKKIIALDKYINQALYDKSNGYYMKKVPFGRSGDFITSPDISIMFSEMITLWIILFWKNLNSPKKFNLIELGAGNAEMLFQIIRVSKNFLDFKKSVNFFVYEKSNYLSNIQRSKLKGENVKWIKNFSELNKSNCLFIGNEFLDAFAIKQFEKKNNNWYEKYVEETKNYRKIRNIKTSIKEHEEKIGLNLSKNQKFIELSYDKINFLKRLSKHINRAKGGLLLIDYGYTNGKMFNSLQSVINHKKNNFLENKGDADISYLINFEILKKILIKNNLKVNGITTQGKFLKKLGIFERAEIIAKKKSFINKSDIYYRIDRLTNMKHMGKLFKVIFASSKSIKYKYGFEE